MQSRKIKKWGLITGGVITALIVAVGAELDVVVVDSKNSGGTKGAFVSVEPLSEGGGVTLGTFTSKKDSPAGLDVDVSIMGSITSGGSDDFQGKSSSAEVDFGPVTGEGGMTESGKAVVGAEIGYGPLLVGAALYNTETTIDNSITLFDVNPPEDKLPE